MTDSFSLTHLFFISTFSLLHDISMSTISMFWYTLVRSLKFNYNTLKILQPEEMFTICFRFIGLKCSIIIIYSWSFFIHLHNLASGYYTKVCIYIYTRRVSWRGIFRLDIDVFYYYYYARKHFFRWKMLSLSFVWPTLYRTGNSTQMVL